MGFLAALVAAFAIGHTYRTLPAALAPTLASALALEPWAIGVYGATFTLVFGVMQLPIGIALDRIDLRRLVVGLLGAAMLGAAVLAAANSLPLLILSQSLIGIGCSGLWLGVCVHVTRVYPAEEFAWITTIGAAIGMTGMFLTATPLAAVIEFAGWRIAVLLVVALTMLLILVVAFVPTRGGTAPAAAATKPAVMSLRELFAIPRILGGVILSLVSYGSLLAIRGLWIGPYLEFVHALSPTQAGNVIFVVSAVMIVAPLALGLADRRGADRRLLIAGAFGIAGVALVVLGVLRPGLAMTAALLVVFVAAASAFVLQYADVRAAAPSGQEGRALSIVNLSLMLGVAGCQIGAGALLAMLERSMAPAQAYGLVFAILGAALIAAAGAYVIITVKPSPQAQSPSAS